MKNDIGQSFSKLVSSFSINRRGHVFELRGNGYQYRNHYFSNLMEVDAFIDKRFEALGNSYQKSLNKLKQNVKSENNSEAR